MSTTTESGSGSGAVNINPGSVQAIARKDFQDAVRSWLFWGLSLFFFTLMVMTALIGGWFADELTGQTLIGWASPVTALVIPLIALVIGWKSITGERETGSIKILLSLPHSRTDVILGKLCGRSAVLSLSLFIGFTAAGLIIAVLAIGQFGLQDITGFFSDYIAFLLISIMYGIAYTSLAVMISSLTRSSVIAGAGVFGVFVLFYVVWNAIPAAVFSLFLLDYISFVETDAGLRPPGWLFFIQIIDPGAAYGTLVAAITSASANQAWGAVNVDVEQFGGTTPFYLRSWFAFLVLLFWSAVPTIVALFRFEQVDL